MIRFSGVNFESDQKQILTNINFEVATGETLTLAGPSGSGKSTILKLAAKIISPTAGKIEFDGQDIAELSPAGYRQDVSYCFQQPVLFGAVAEDSFKFVYEIRNQEYRQEHVIETLQSLDLKPDILKRKVNELSGGEKQRVALARNTLFLPKVLLLDEVTTGLDLTTKNLILGWLDQLNQERGVTLIKVTHEEDEISDSKHILRILDGRLQNNE